MVTFLIGIGWHPRHQGYYDAFVKFFAYTYDVFYDKSLKRAYENDDTDYV